MHIPDGFLDARTCIGTYCLAGAGLAWAGREVAARWQERTTPLLGVMSAFIFAGQMVNFPIAGGTSGHLVGGVLASVLLGPGPAILALTLVLIVQCFLFQDGGVTTLGANVLNMALIGVGVGYLIYRLLRSRRAQRGWLLASIGIASWCSVVIAAAACACELASADTIPLSVALPAMVLTHAAIGIGEALITVAVVSFVLKVRPDLLYEPTAKPAAPIPWRRVTGTGLVAALGVAVLLAPLASSWPDGLMRVAQRFGFAHQAQAINSAPLADYTFPGLGSGPIPLLIAGVLGTLAVFAVAWALGMLAARWLRRSRSHSGPH